jgi:hypothetical protein
LGGRIDFDNLYPKEYCKYLNKKIKELNPNKIICHSYIYAQKYYNYGILDENTKIDIVLTWATYLYEDKERYTTSDSDIKEKISKKYNIKTKLSINDISYINILYNKNKNCKFIFYIPGYSCNMIDNKPQFEHINFLYWYLSKRDILPKNKIDINNYLNDTYEKKFNCTDGFLYIDFFIKKLNFRNINLIGFSTFGSNEKNLNDVYLNENNTTEKQNIESEILQMLVKNRYINSLENLKK